MYKIFFICFFSFVSCFFQLNAEEKITGLEFLGTVLTKDYYAYTDSLQKFDSAGAPRADFWILMNSKTPELHEGKILFSIQQHWQINCKTKELAISYVAAYGQKMAKGLPLFIEEYKNQWKPINAPSMEEKIFLRFCKQDNLSSKENKTSSKEDTASELGLVEFSKDSSGTTYLLPIKDSDADKKLGIIGVGTVKNFNKSTPSPQGDFKSIFLLDVCDCKKNKTALIAMKVYTGDFMTGKQIFNKPYSYSDSIWKPIPKGTGIEKLCRLGCDYLYLVKK